MIRTWLFVLLIFSCNPVSENERREDSMRIANRRNDSLYRLELIRDSIDLMLHTPLKRPVTAAKNNWSDSTYVIGDFLFTGRRDMKFDFFRNTKPTPVGKRVSTGDTLYHDTKFTLLGNLNDLTDRCVYKKYINPYKFQRFSVDSIYSGKLAKPDFITDPSARLFRSAIRQDCAAYGVNFAGHFTIAEWGCGAMCQLMAVIDRINGHIYYSTIPFDTMDGHYGDNYRKDSKMIIINTGFLDEGEALEHKGYYQASWGRRPSTYEWCDSVFVKID